MKGRGFFPSDNSRVQTTTARKIISGTSWLELTESKGKYVGPGNSESLNIVLRPSRATFRGQLREWSDSRVEATTWLKNSDWPMKNRRSSGIVAPITSEFYVIVWLSRLVGCHPLVNPKSFVISAIVKLWSLVWIAVLTVAFALELRNLYLCRVFGSATDDLCTLTIIDRLTVITGHVLCAAGAVIKAGDFDVGTRRIQDFDEATFQGTKFDVRMNAVSVAALTVTLGSMFYLYDVANTDGKNLTSVVYKLCICVMTLELHKCCFVFVAVLRRFMKFKALALAGKIDVGVTKGVYYQTLTVQHVFVLNYWLTEAVNNFNSYFGAQIIYWIAYSTVSAIVYTFAMANMMRKSFVGWQQFSRLAMFVYHPALICIVAHFTSKRANELGRLLFGCRVQSLDTTYSSLEILELGYYLYHVPVKISGMKMFYIDLPFLLSVLEVSATYTTFILQNAPEVYNKLRTDNGTELK